MHQTINDKIRRAFSESAAGYDSQTSLHRGIADKLLAQALDDQPATLLDVGCGTGYLTAKAKELLPQSQIIGFDFAEGMLDVARARHPDITWTLGDIHQLPFVDGNFDLVISNLAYQWAEDLEKAFREARRVLGRGKILTCTLFGFHTCHELLECLEEAKAGNMTLNRLPHKSQVTEALQQAGFIDIAVKLERIQLTFSDMYAFLNWLKSIGANNLLQEGYVGPQALSRAAAIYKQRFACDNGINATFEVIGVYAKK